LKAYKVVPRRCRNGTGTAYGKQEWLDDLLASGEESTAAADD